MQNKSVAVVIPFYKTDLSDLELVALTQCFKVLGGHPIIAVKPQRLSLPARVQEFLFKDVINFEDSYFQDIQGYNKLMLSREFYGSFLNYSYILIYQLDAFVFKNELNYWCDKGFDYIGAPWLREFHYPDIVKALKTKIQKQTHTWFNTQKNGVPSPLQFEDKVGNGGFSLRRVQKFYDLSSAMQHKISVYLSRHEHQFNEDAFWSIEVNRKKNILKIPGLKEGLKFAIELFPARGMEINKQQLPFGCHAWDIHLNYWRPIFKQLGYDI